MIDASQVLWSAPPEQRSGRPLLIVLHGHGLDETIGSQMWAELPPELVIAGLRGPLPVRSGFGWFPLNANVTAQDVDDAAQSVLDWLQAQAVETPVGVLGFSQGSAVALQCLRLRPERFAYAVVLSGFVVPGANAGDRELARHRPPVFAARGGQDRLVPDFLAELTDRWLAAHTTLTSRHYPDLGHTVSPVELRDLRAYLVEQLSAHQPQ